MSVNSICKTNVITIQKNANLKEASKLMQKHHVGSLIVTESFNGKRIPSGILMDRDIALSVSSSPKPQELKVENIMLSQPITVNKADGIFETVKTMNEHGVKRLPVVDSDGSLYGIICADDLLSLLAEEVGELSKITEAQVKKEKGIRMPSERHVQL